MPLGFYLEPVFGDISQCETQTVRAGRVGKERDPFLLAGKETLIPRPSESNAVKL